MPACSKSVRGGGCCSSQKIVTSSAWVMWSAERSTLLYKEMFPFYFWPSIFYSFCVSVTKKRFDTAPLFPYNLPNLTFLFFISADKVLFRLTSQVLDVCLLTYSMHDMRISLVISRYLGPIRQCPHPKGHRLSGALWELYPWSVCDRIRIRRQIEVINYQFFFSTFD